MNSKVIALSTLAGCLGAGLVLAGTCPRTKVKVSLCPLGEYMACSNNYAPNPTGCGDVVKIHSANFSCESNDAEGDAGRTKCVQPQTGEVGGHNVCATRTTTCNSVLQPTGSVKCVPVGTEFFTHYVPYYVTTACSQGEN
jgi:hypothetical protein